MFRDKMQIRVKAGDGGDGIVSMGPFKKSDGGEGGNGGNFYLIGTNSRYDLRHLRHDNIYKAENGVRGGKNNLTGANGEDYLMPVPLATVVYDENGEVLGEVTGDQEKLLLFEGGRGGKGNYAFRGSREYGNWNKFTYGEKVPEHSIKLELQLESDVIFIGFPNAGKSTILNELTNADAKIAPYAFTTIDPQKGRLDEYTLLDLPGLIEGTYEGKGLGTKFVKHTRRTRFVAHFVSFENEDMIDTYKRMREELKHIDEELFNRPELIILSKNDVADSKRIKEMEKKFSKFSKNVISTNFLENEEVDKLKSFFREVLA